jgi:hypothetical protein
MAFNGQETLKRHRLNATMARIKVRGLSVIDKRSLAARAMLEWKAQLIEDLGGEEAISAQERALVELATRSRLIVEHLDAFLLSQKSLIDRRKRSVYPVVQARNSAANALVNHLCALGLGKREKPVKSLAEYIAERESKGDEHLAGDGGPEVICEDVPTQEGAVEEGSGG